MKENSFFKGRKKRQKNKYDLYEKVMKGFILLVRWLSYYEDD